MPRQTGPNANNALGNLLQAILPRSQVRSENTRAVDGHYAATAMEEGIEWVAKTLDKVDNTRPGIAMAVAQRLGMTNVPQTRRMACAIIANTLAADTGTVVSV